MASAFVLSNAPMVIEYHFRMEWIDFDDKRQSERESTVLILLFLEVDDGHLNSTVYVH